MEEKKSKIFGWLKAHWKIWIFKDQRSLDVANKQKAAFRAGSLQTALNTESRSHKNWSNF